MSGPSMKKKFTIRYEWGCMLRSLSVSMNSLGARALYSQTAAGGTQTLHIWSFSLLGLEILLKVGKIFIHAIYKIASTSVFEFVL